MIIIRVLTHFNCVVFQFHFTKELEDQHVMEKENGIFVCETNKKKIPVDWFIDDKPVVPGMLCSYYIKQITAD